MEENSLNGLKLWFAIGIDELVEGTVIHTFEHNGGLHYVLELETIMGPLLEVRHWGQVSFTKNGPLNMFKEILNDIGY